MSDERFDAACQCEYEGRPFICSRHGITKVETTWMLCQQRPDIRKVLDNRAGIDLPEEQYKPAGLGKKVLSAAKAAGKFLANGCKTVGQEVYDARLTECKQCEQWTGRTCKLCGCSTALKLRLPAETCPVGKWGAAEKPEPFQVGSGSDNGSASQADAGTVPEESS